MRKRGAVRGKDFIHSLPTLRSEAALTRLSADWIMTTVMEIFESAASPCVVDVVFSK